MEMIVFIKIYIRAPWLFKLYGQEKEPKMKSHILWFVQKNQKLKRVKLVFLTRKMISVNYNNKQMRTEKSSSLFLLAILLIASVNGQAV